MQAIALPAAELVLVAVLIANVFLVLGNIIARDLVGASLVWVQEVSELALSALTFVGSAVAFAHDKHPSLELLRDYLPERARRLQSAFVTWIVVDFAGVAALVSIQSMGTQNGIAMALLPISRVWIVVPAVIGFGLTVLIGLDRLRRQDRFSVLSTGGALLLLIAAWISTQSLWLPLVGSSFLLALVWSVVIALFLFGVPVAYAIGCAALIYMYASGSTPLETLTVTMMSPLSNYVLLAIPFFVLAGLIMARGRIAGRLADLLLSVLGRWRGGLLHAQIVAMYIESGISGSKAADMTMIAASLSKALRDKGYRPEESAAVLAAAAVMGETIPPSNNILVLGSITSLSVAAMFAAGLLPAAVIAAALMAAVAVRARLVQLPRGHAANGSEIFGYARGAALPLLMPIILIGGIVFGIATPTEISAVAVIYGFVLAMALRDLRLGEIYPAFRDSITMGGMVMFVVSMAASFSWVLTILGLPATITNALSTLPNNQAVFLIVASLALVVLGCLFEGIPAMLVFAPLLVPTAQALGISGLHFGIVLIIAIGLGTMAPPLGVGFYVACGIAGASPARTMRVMLPYLIVLLFGLLVVDLVPAITLVVPEAFHLSTK